MNNPFFETSRNIANDFLQNIVFIDDKAFLSEDKSNHHFNALLISKAFANSKKVCAVYNPETSEDINTLIHIAKKSDITVIDWQINIEDNLTGSEEDDAEEDDPRGPHTRKIIREILIDPLTGKGSIKLIIIYTGEIDLYDITDAIYDDLNKHNFQGLTKGDCQVYTENIKILVVAKPSTSEGEPKFKHTSVLNEKVVNYEELPDFILNEFTKMTSGLLSNFILEGLTILRQNTFRLISLFNKNLDSAFLLHRILLPNQEDAGEHLIEIFSNSLLAILQYGKIDNTLSKSNIKQWAGQRDFQTKIKIAKKEFTIDSEFVYDCLEQCFVEAIIKRWPEELTNNKRHDIEKEFNKLYINYPKIFYSQDENDSNEKFSILTHHKSILKQVASNPIMSLGTVVKEENLGRYYLCIQAKCDSLRFSTERRFLFLQLIPVEEDTKFHFIVEYEGAFVRLRLLIDSYELRTIKFPPNKENQVLSAVNIDGRYFFESIYKEKFIWLADLKDAHAQRVANKYAAELSRVGLDESEWLRRWSGN